MDECYIGGKPRKGSGPNKRGRGTKKTTVVGMAQRKGKIKAQVVKKGKLNSKNLNSLVRKNVDVSNATLITDEFKGYLGIKKMMPHRTIDHRIWYVDGDIHTNNIESFWALLKRGIIGQYHKVSLKHLNEYIDEFSYRFNNRKNEDVFNQTLAKAVGGKV